SLIVGQTVEEQPALRPLALALYERAMKDDSTSNNLGLQFALSPAKRLAALYKKDGRSAEARALVLKALAKSEERIRGTNYVNAASATSSRVSELNAVAGFFLEIGFPADALRVYNEVLGLADAVREAQPYLGNSDYVLHQARSGADRALGGL